MGSRRGVHMRSQIRSSTKQALVQTVMEPTMGQMLALGAEDRLLRGHVLAAYTLHAPADAGPARRALAIASEFDDIELEAKAMIALAKHHRAAERHIEAERLNRTGGAALQAMTLDDDLRWWLSTYHCLRGIDLDDEARLAESASALASSLDLSAAIGDRAGVQRALVNLGFCRHRQGDLSAAVALQAQLASLIADRPDNPYRSAALEHLGDVHAAIDRLEAARSALRAARAIEVSYFERILQTTKLARIEARLGSLTAAEDELAAVATASGPHPIGAFNRTHIELSRAEVHRLSGQLPEANQRLDAAEEAMAGTRSWALRWEARLSRGLVQLADPDQRTAAAGAGLVAELVEQAVLPADLERTGLQAVLDHHLAGEQWRAATETALLLLERDRSTPVDLEMLDQVRRSLDRSSLDEATSEAETTSTATGATTAADPATTHPGRTGVAAIVHDLRSPLQAAQLSIDLAAAKSEKGEAIATNLSVARMALDEAQSRMTTELGLATTDPCFRPIDLTEAVALAGRRMQAIATECGITIVVSVPDRVVVRGRASWVGRIVDNLVDNAIAFSEVGSTIDVTVHADPGSPDRVTITVEDRGPGVDPDRLCRIFDRGESGRASTGLGLATVRQLAEAMGGTVRAENRRDGPGLAVLVELTGSPATP